MKSAACRASACFPFQDSQKPVDMGRRFILSYFLSNDDISIFEKPTNNSGIIGGRFLEKTRIPKPGSTADNPKYYSPADLAIGAKVDGNITDRDVLFPKYSWRPTTSASLLQFLDIVFC